VVSSSCTCARSVNFWFAHHCEPWLLISLVNKLSVDTLVAAALGEPVSVMSFLIPSAFERSAAERRHNEVTLQIITINGPADENRPGSSAESQET